MIIFDGKSFAAQKEASLLKEIDKLEKETDKRPRVACLVFVEDKGGIVYSKEKKTVAERLGISYEIIQTSITHPLHETLAQIEEWNNNQSVTGIIVQKPWKKTWEEAFVQTTTPTSFQDWWQRITSLLSIFKDIDGLHPSTLELIKLGRWKQEQRTIPATCRAVLSILEEAEKHLHKPLHLQPTLIIGRSELMGSPLFFELQHRGWEHVTLAGQHDFKDLISKPEKLTKFSSIISSTGINHLIHAELVSEGCVAIDAGFPRGDIDFDTVKTKASFITPVPNGVGPVTVISLLENAVDLCYNSRS